MSQKILILNPWGAGYMDTVTEEVVAPYLHPDTDVVCTNLGPGASPMPWPVPESRPLAVERAMQAQADGFDAIVIGCCADPFLLDIRKAVSIPVVGVTESVASTARNRGKVAVLTRQLEDAYQRLIPSQAEWELVWSRRLTSYRLQPEEFCLGQVFVPKHPDPDTLLDLTARDPARLRDLTIGAMDEALHSQGLEQARAVAKAAGATAVFFGCAFWSKPIAALGEAAAAFGIPVINPLVSATSYAEHLLLSRG